MNDCMAELEQKIRELLVLDETSPSGLSWNQIARKHVRGKPAGWPNGRGYWRVQLSINAKRMRFCAHRIVWFLANGHWPKEQIDHINGNRSDNLISNLREASHGENQMNTGKREDNSSGVKGVCFNGARGKWQARVMFERKRISLGYFANLADAERAVIAAREKHHGEYANHGAQLYDGFAGGLTEKVDA